MMKRLKSYDQLAYPANPTSSESWKAPSGITIMIIKGVAADWKITAVYVSTTKRIS